jgi:hypothetical protein
VKFAIIREKYQSKFIPPKSILRACLAIFNIQKFPHIAEEFVEAIDPDELEDSKWFGEKILLIHSKVCLEFN